MNQRQLPLSLRLYIALHVAALAPALWAAGRAPAPDSAWLVAVLLTAAIVAGTWKISLTVLGGKQSLVFAVVCLALLLQGLLAAVLCAAVGALVTHLVRPDETGRRLQLTSDPNYRRVFNVAHCALACAVSGLVPIAAAGMLPAGWVGDLCSLGLFAITYFLLNTFGVASAIAMHQGLAPVQVWREHYFWTAPGYLVSAAAAAEIGITYDIVGPAALVLLPSLYFVYRAYLAYVDTLARERALKKEIELLYHAEEEAGRRKDEFLAMLAHELRTPLGAISNAHYLLAAGSPRAADRYVDVIGRQTRHLRRLVDDLLDVSRITRGAIELRTERVDLRRVLDNSLEALGPVFRDNRQDLAVQVESGSLPVEADPVRIEQVFSNLLGNAAKYTDPHGRIEISLRAEAGDAILRVRDSGVGIEPDLLPRVFELFVQAERSPCHGRGGLGIGLNLVKTLVELHGGAVEVRSEGMGRGSEFEVRLPLCYTPPELAAGLPEGAARRGSLSIVVVEDHPDAAESLADMLESWGHTVQLATTGSRGVDMVRNVRPEVVILDIGLPDLDGYQAARQIREELGADAMLIALTGYGQERDRASAFDAGFDHHLVKPADPEQLRRMVEGAQPARSTSSVCAGAA